MDRGFVLCLVSFVGLVGLLADCRCGGFGTWCCYGGIFVTVTGCDWNW